MNFIEQFKGLFLTIMCKFGFHSQIIDKIQKRISICDECNMMVNYEDPDKWYKIKKCPKCGKSTAILKKAWDNNLIFKNVL